MCHLYYKIREHILTTPITYAPFQINPILLAGLGNNILVSQNSVLSILYLKTGFCQGHAWVMDLSHFSHFSSMPAYSPFATRVVIVQKTRGSELSNCFQVQASLFLFLSFSCLSLLHLHFVCAFPYFPYFVCVCVYYYVIVWSIIFTNGEMLVSNY